MEAGPGHQNGPRTIMGSIRQYKYITNIILACIAIALEVYYSICAGSCSYLQGSIFGIDLQYVGIAYMAFIILLSILKKDIFLFFIISAGVGIEFYLIGFQVWYDTYCPYCLAFGGIIFALYVMNFIRRYIVLSLLSMGAALILFAVLFKGSLAPAYTYTFLR
ncbi:MAG: putative rane protein [Deltaproteobacteria bacterium]|nr:putative rane protein [Deltaproteobacteria bacterium]